jgi:NAD(P)-dependent dehydrogenase (short-subunit alcohol dehydrogenase family)
MHAAIQESATLLGRTALVTGATSGMGLEAAVKLARLRANVAIVARDRARGEKALADVKTRGGSDSVALFLCDFASQDDVRRLAADFRAAYDRLDILVNNAGSVNDARLTTPEGIELTFAVNHLGPFLLTNLLLDMLEKSAPSRIVNVASVGHRGGDLDFDNLHYEKGGYWIMKAYARSKLANVLFTAELSRRLEGKGVTVNALHPGGVRTGIWAHAPCYARPLLPIAKLFMISAEEGADRILYLAAGSQVEGESGKYYEKNRAVLPSRAAQDAALAQKLWDVSANLTHMA